MLTPGDDPTGVLTFLAARAVPGVEEVAEGRYRRTLHGGVVAPRIEELVHAVDLPTARAVLGSDERLAPLLAVRPELRVPAALDPAEVALRAVLGQNVTVAAARRLTERIVLAHGDRLAEPDGSLTHLFPTPAVLAGVDPGTLPLPAARARALVGLAEALAHDEAVLGSEPRLLALPGIGPWTAGYVRLRAVGDPDAFVPGDAVLHRLGVTPERAERWRPFRALAVIHLWAGASRAP